MQELVDIKQAEQKITQLLPRHELFCRAILNPEFGGVAYRAYLKVYPNSSLESAYAESSTLLRKPKIRERLRELIEADGWNDEAVDRKTLYWLQSDNAKASMSAIQEYNKLKKRTEIEGKGGINIEKMLVINREQRDGVRRIGEPASNP